jgi:cobalt-zinc-cadmium efflux system outer membrane protein
LETAAICWKRCNRYAWPGLGVVILLICSGASALAAAAAPGDKGLASLIAIALSHNPGLKSAQRQADAAALKVAPAASLPDPEFMVETMNNPLGSAMAENQGFEYSWRQMIPYPGKLNAAAARQRAEADAARETYAMKAADLKKDVALMYYGIAAMDARLAVEYQKQKQLEAVGAVIAARFAGGKATLSEYIRTHNMKAMARTDSAAMAAERERMAADLAAMLGGPIPKDTVFSADPAPLKQLPKETELVDKALAGFPELRMKRAMERRMTAEVEQMRLEPLPDFMLSGALETMKNGDKTYSLGVAIPLPLFYKTKQAPLIDAAAAMREATTGERREAENRIAQQVRARYAALAKANEALTLYQTALKSGTQQAFDVALKDYQIGRIGFSELIETFQAVYDTLSGIEKSKQWAMEERVYLEFYTGSPLRGEEKP